MSDRPLPSSGLTDLAPGAPHNREAEEAVLGAVLVNPEAYYDVASFLAPDDFFLHRNRWVWDAFNSLHDRAAADGHPDRLRGTGAAGAPGGSRRTRLPGRR